MQKVNFFLGALYIIWSQYIFFEKNVGKKLNIFRKGGMGGYPFAENSAEMIYLIFKPFPKQVSKEVS